MEPKRYTDAIVVARILCALATQFLCSSESMMVVYGSRGVEKS